ncbi:MAG: glycerophosphodiester phosphodiesterase [bacterium]|nr:glycerophosphodiester phosphodiesterase [bacterium]
MAPVVLQGTARALPQDREPIVIAHRGASGFLPEHTIESYLVGILQGADFIEPDLVATRDGVLIARHENALATVRLDDQDRIVLDADGRPTVTSETTNVATKPEFAERLTVKSIDGVAVGGWFSEDFALAEIKQLFARERIPTIRPRNAESNDRFQIPTLSEILLLVRLVEGAGVEVGIYPELKHPTFFAKEGRRLDGRPIAMSLGRKLIDALVDEGFTDPERLFIQSFEIECLRELRRTILPAARIELPLVQLYGDIDGCCVQPGGSFSRPYDVRYNALAGADLEAIYGELTKLVTLTSETSYGQLVRSDVLDYVASYADGLGPWKNSFLRRAPLHVPVDGDRDGAARITSKLSGDVHPFLKDALSAGLLVHPYTLRAEEDFLTVNADGVPQSITGEVVQLLALGVDGFFTDQPIDGVAGREQFLALQGREKKGRTPPKLNDSDYGQLMGSFNEKACKANPLYCR